MFLGLSQVGVQRLAQGRKQVPAALHAALGPLPICGQFADLPGHVLVRPVREAAPQYRVELVAGFPRPVFGGPRPRLLVEGEDVPAGVVHGGAPLSQPRVEVDGGQFLAEGGALGDVGDLGVVQRGDLHTQAGDLVLARGLRGEQPDVHVGGPGQGGLQLLLLAGDALVVRAESARRFSVGVSGARVPWWCGG